MIHIYIFFSRLACFTYLPTCLLAYLPTCLLAYLPTCLLAYLPTCLLAYMVTRWREQRRNWVQLSGNYCYFLLYCRVG
ncbi:hypothetical protein G3D78_000265 [Escherichia coli]|nr:hypothetical protein [Escherichia coli]